MLELKLKLMLLFILWSISIQKLFDFKMDICRLHRCRCFFSLQLVHPQTASFSTAHIHIHSMKYRGVSSSDILVYTLLTVSCYKTLTFFFLSFVKINSSFISLGIYCYVFCCHCHCRHCRSPLPYLFGCLNKHETIICFVSP